MDTAAYTIPEFCFAHRISRATFYNLMKAGLGPRTMQVGGRVLISKEAGGDWRKAREDAGRHPVAA
ncbi:hypothetical protein [Mesorhizobium amorphae]|uniref:hypothetical protein n=1 Tax=Mesorhizobium amorphae TaxID=71433 RepID=UPI0017869CFA|nr:hypothetical protein [Mesorhizobium amorphae]